MTSTTVCVVGLGYIGLPTAAILASNGVNVIGVDINERTVEAVNRGDVPFVEPDLATYVAGAVTQGTLRATTKPEPADAFIVAVPTPFTDGHKPDLSYIQAAAGAIAPHLSADALVILESTSPPQATQQMADWILAARPDLSLDGSEGRAVIHVAHCPERVLPGRVMIELVTNDRIVGGLTAAAAEHAKELYQVFCQGEILLTDAVTAEMAKLVENSYRDVNIAFANELSLISADLGIDVWELIRLANHHPRVNILQPGPGVGGHCIAVDPWFIVDAAPERARIIRAAREVNDAKPRHVIDEVLSFVRAKRPQRIAIMGLTFKPNIDDLRQSPSVEIATTLLADLDESVTQLVVVEPHIEHLPSGLETAKLTRRPEELNLEEFDLLVVLVAHSAFTEILRGEHAVPILDFAGTSKRRTEIVEA
ncbi:UDP-N-acetyl-D-mannosamine dehydrogenase [Cellulosimicrobium sp. PMB13]|uniref:UDP-N-acetyl-D-mannosamine dehydrogenase n=1 Tax=Cellulosimicrobium sp. PMB13 TaxID=3120158 RepID=UPI003F4BF6A2